MPAARKLIVSFHDLHPGSRAQCERFLALMRELGVTRTTLLVVPRWHGAPPCDEDREFAAWLRERAAEGHEICLHAYLHEAAEVTGNAVQRAMGKHYTAGEGEFYQIDVGEAERRLREGLRIVRDGPAARRRFIDMQLSQIRPSFHDTRTLRSVMCLIRLNMA